SGSSSRPSASGSATGLSPIVSVVFEERRIARQFAQGGRSRLRLLVHAPGFGNPQTLPQRARCLGSSGNPCAPSASQPDGLWASRIQRPTRKPMAISTKPPSGTRDFLPADVLARRAVIDAIRGAYERHGFAPLETPALERLDVLTGKYGDEGDQLMFKV